MFFGENAETREVLEIETEGHLRRVYSVFTFDTKIFLMKFLTSVHLVSRISLNLDTFGLIFCIKVTFSK